MTMVARHLVLSILLLALASACNICGENNTIQFPTGVLVIEYKNETLRNNCNTWQKTANNPVAISDSFCRNELYRKAVEVCRCATPDGEFVSELLKETEAPGEKPMTTAPETETDGDNVFGTQEPQEEEGNNENDNQDSGCLAMQSLLCLLGSIMMTSWMMS
jgi:hypothetical protein